MFKIPETGVYHQSIQVVNGTKFDQFQAFKQIQDSLHREDPLAIEFQPLHPNRNSEVKVTTGSQNAQNLVRGQIQMVSSHRVAVSAQAQVLKNM